MANKLRKGTRASKQQRRAQAAGVDWNAQAELLALAATAARIGMFEWNLGTERVLWTDQHALLLGVRDQAPGGTATTPVAMTSEHVYRDWADRVHPEDLPRVEAEVRRCRAEGVPYECEYRVIWPDGSVRWLIGRGQFQYDANGVAQKMLGTTMDITDRKRAEHGLAELNATLERRIAERTMELRLSQRRNAAIVEAAFDAIVTIGREGSIVSCNPAAERMFGYAAETLIGLNLHLLLTELRDVNIDDGREVARHGGLRLALARTSQHWARRKDGTRFPVHMSFGEVSDLGLGVCILRDVTEERALQKEILRISTLEQRRIGQELHDGPLQDLAGIGLLAESLSDALREASNPCHDLAARLASEVSAVNRGIRLLAEGLVPVPVNSRGLVRALRGLARTTERRHGLRCEFSQAGPAPKVEDDVASHVYRIAREAVANAVKHSGAQKVEIRLEHGPNAVHLEVCDDGVGMQPGGQASSGLGLHTMKYRCALMGGTFTVGRRAPGGTRISCAIPLPEASE